MDNLQRCKAFKFRGALSKVSTLPKGSTIVCASAGNHSQGCSLSAKLCGMKCIVYMPETAPITKVAATRHYGAEVKQVGASFDAANEQCQKDCKEHPDWIFVPPFDCNEVIAGQGTISLELIEQVKDIDYVVVAVGGGGLAAGVGIGIKALSPKTKIIAVNAAIRPATYIKYKKEKGQEYDKSVEEAQKSSEKPLADGIAVINPGKITFPYLLKVVDDFVVVTEEEIAKTIAIIAERCKLIVEGAGASTIAAVLFNKFTFAPNSKIICVASGGNIEMRRLADCYEKSKDYLNSI
jgi:threonine dehydratase